ncbi:hypothetical protein GCK32_004982 [Trichostrongylus colubriformis]|uniref:Uncharacterized protein n=1 Tax=Trichostrongylus colubriformis TaxID=6319 RepID=A0AAN8FB56_TRICO
MELECSIADCVAVVHTRIATGNKKKGRKDVLLRLKDPDGELLSEIQVPWPDGEPDPCEIKYLDSEECVRLTNNATFATVPLRISKLREVVANRRKTSTPKRFSCFSSSPCPVEDASQSKLHTALKEFVKDPNICEVLKRTNVFGLSCLASFYELCLNLEQITLVRSAIESSDALSEQCLAVLLNFVAKSSEDSIKDDHLLGCLLTRHFDPRQMADAAARTITTQNASILIQKCMKLYVSPKQSDVAEEALSLMTVLTDVFGNRLVWENDLHHVAEEALEFSERMSEVVSLFSQIELRHKQSERKREEEESHVQYKIEKISLPRRTLNW